MSLDVASDENTLEVVGCTGDRLAHHWRDAVDPWRWHGPYEIIAVALSDSRSAVHGVSGNLALAQSRYGVMRQNLELIVPDAQRGIRHLYREQDDDRFTPWRLAPSFAAGTGRIDAVTMIVSNFTDRGNLEVVARAGDRLWFAWRDASLAWNGPIALVADGVDVKGASGVRHSSRAPTGFRSGTSSWRCRSRAVESVFSSGTTILPLRFNGRGMRWACSTRAATIRRCR